MATFRNIRKHEGSLNVTQVTCKDKGGSAAPVPAQGGELDALQ